MTRRDTPRTCGAYKTDTRCRAMAKSAIFPLIKINSLRGQLTKQLLDECTGCFVRSSPPYYRLLIFEFFPNGGIVNKTYAGAIGFGSFAEMIPSKAAA